MTDTEVTTLGLVSVALLNLIGLIYVGWNSRRAAQDARMAVTVAVETKDNVALIEKATNSMKDALVDATRREALLKGQKDERAAGDLRNEAAALGRAEVREAQMRTAVSEAVGGIAAGPVEGVVDDGKLTVEKKT